MRRTHKRSCLLDSFSIVTDISPERLIKEIGHDGFDNGFHTQELIEVISHRGFSATLIERSPVALNPETGQVRKINFRERSADRRFADCVWDSTGVLIGENRHGKPHAVAWEFNRIWDPSDGGCYSYIEADIGVHPSPEPRFVARAFLRIERVYEHH